MNGYHHSIILATIAKDPEPIAIVKGEKDISGCDILVALNQSDFVNGKWTEYTRWIKLTAWYSMAKKLQEAKWCRKGYHALFTCRTKERAYLNKDGQTRKTLDYEILDAHPILVGQDASGQARARSQAHVETERAPQQSPRVTAPAPHPINNTESEDDIPF